MHITSTIASSTYFQQQFQPQNTSTGARTTIAIFLQKKYPYQQQQQQQQKSTIHPNNNINIPTTRIATTSTRLIC